MNTVDQKVGKRIAGERKIAGYTQAELAEKVGMWPENISRLETGAAMPSLARLAAIARVLDIDLHQLFWARRKARPEDEAIERLVWLLSRRTAAEIELVTTLAAAVFKHVG